MRRGLWISVCVALCALLRPLPGHAADIEKIAAGRASIEVAFPPWDDAETLLADAIAGTHRQILVQAFLLTSRTIAFSLIEAKLRGVEVMVLADGRQHAETPGSLLDLLARHGIPVWLETRYRNAHNKIVVIDADERGNQSEAAPVVISGSYNFTWAAQHMNAENLIVIRNHPVLADRFARNWRRHQQQATPLQSLSQGDSEH